MKATLVIEGETKIEIELGYEDVYSVASNLPDAEDFAAVYAVLAAHPSISVRECVAGKDKLDDSTVNLLADDADISVIRALVRSDKARECLGADKLIEMIKRDVDTAESIAAYVDRYENASADLLAEALFKHPDPRVRNALAGNYSTPKKILKNLLKDQDARVRASAKQSLD